MWVRLGSPWTGRGPMWTGRRQTAAPIVRSDPPNPGPLWTDGCWVRMMARPAAAGPRHRIVRPDMRIDTQIDMRTDMRVDMCMDMCIGTPTSGRADGDGRRCGAGGGLAIPTHPRSGWLRALLGTEEFGTLVQVPICVNRLFSPWPIWAWPVYLRPMKLWPIKVWPRKLWLRALLGTNEFGAGAGACMPLHMYVHASIHMAIHMSVHMSAHTAVHIAAHVTVRIIFFTVSIHVSMRMLMAASDGAAAAAAAAARAQQRGMLSRATWHQRGGHRRVPSSSGIPHGSSKNTELPPGTGVIQQHRTATWHPSY